MGTAERIFEELHDDLVSHGWLVQSAADDGQPWVVVLRDLLESFDVEVGETRNESGTYVSFTAWSGAVDERLARAVRQVEQSADPDTSFVYWLCLRENVDTFEHA